MTAPAVSEREPGNRVQILSSIELCRTLDRLASQILESVVDPEALVLLGIPTRGVALAQVLADRLALMVGHAVAHGSLDATQLPVSLDGRHVVLVDDVIFTGRTVRAALEALQSWGRPHRVQLVAMVDRGHRELPIQPDFCGRVVPTTRLETIQLCLQSVDGEEGVYLIRPRS
jgi:pyrimidine operon attenuation protein/uracil phosphoribosyltransferase